MISISAEHALRMEWELLPLRDSIKPPEERPNHGTFGSELRRLGDPRLDYASKEEIRALADLLVERGVSRSELARRDGVWPQYVTSLLAGKRRVSRQRLARLRDAVERRP